MHKKLFIPGPVEVRQEVLSQMALPLIGHRGKDASQLQENIINNFKKIFYTNEQILLSTSSGSGLMEGAIRSCTLKKAAVFSIGAFGDRWYEMAISNNIVADKFEKQWGEAFTKEEIERVLETGEYDLITITHNETSTGVMNPIEEIAEVIGKYPDIIFCVDAVSSAVGSKIEVDKLGIDIQKPDEYDSDFSDVVYTCIGFAESETGYEIDIYGNNQFVSVVIIQNDNNILKLEVFGMN